MQIPQPVLRDYNADEAEVLVAFLTGRDLGCTRVASVAGLLISRGVVVAARLSGALRINQDALLQAPEAGYLIESLEGLARLSGKTITTGVIRVKPEAYELMPRTRETLGSVVDPWAQESDDQAIRP